MKVPVLGLGTWGIGGKDQGDSSSDSQAVAAIQSGIELGMTHIDTAEFYGAGHTEELVGEAIAPYRRNQLFVTTKVYRTHLRHNDLMRAMKNSLRRLRLDYVDLYLIHWPNPEVPLKETMKALDLCVEEGLTRFIGVSNFTLQLLQKAQSYLQSHRLVANQIYYNLARYRKTSRIDYVADLRSYGVEDDIVTDFQVYCVKNNIMLIAYTPLEGGKLAKPGYPVLDEIAEKYGKTPAQVSLNWLISQERIITIAKASNIKHIEENIGAVGWRLSKEDSNRLQDSFR